MKRLLYNILAILVLSMTTGIVSGQDNRTLDTKVADILAQMPAKDPVHLQKVMQEVIDLGPEGFQKVTRLLVAPGTGDDTAVRFALNSVSRFTSQFGKEEDKAFAESGLIAALQAHSDKDVKTFLMNQLNLVGGEKTIDAVKIYLNDEYLAEPAVQTIFSINEKRASVVILEAMKTAGAKVTPTLVKALGDMKCTEAAPVISGLAYTSDVELKRTVLESLARIGHPESYKILLGEAKKVNFAYDKTGAAQAFIRYADRLGETGETALCKKACEEIYKANQAPEKLHNFSAALSVYTRHFGSEVTPVLLKVVESSDKTFRQSVLNLAENTGDIAATRKWTEKAKNSTGELKAEIIDMLGRRGDPLAISIIRESLQSADPMVRAESVGALYRLEGKKAVPELISHLEKGQDIEVTKQALLVLLDQSHLSPLSGKIGSTSGKTKAAFIELAAAKSGNSFFNQIFTYTRSADADEKAAAFAALKRISSRENLQQLTDLLLSVSEDKEIAEVQQAIVAVVRDLPSEKEENGLLLTALKKTDKKERILTVLPEIGGETALKAITGYFNGSEGKTKQAAFNALTNWKDYSASGVLYQICQNTQGDFKTRAFASFVKQVQRANLPDDQKLLQYRKIMPFASSDAEKIQVVNSIGNLKTFLSIIYLEKLLDEKATEQAAARAIMKIAMPGEEQGGFSGNLVKKILTRVANVITGEESEYDKINIRNYLDKMVDDQGFTSMFNGKNLEGWQGLVGNPITRAKMSEKELAEKQVEANKKMLENWSVRDGMIIFNGKGDNLCSVKEYGDFELVVDWRISKEGDSGLYLRGSPQVQVWDTSRVEVGAQVGSGGLYNNKIHPSKPLKVADNPIGEWNTFRVTMIGENVTVHLNGELVVDNVTLENYWDRSQPIFKTGAIELQAHGNELAFRDIYVREIKTSEIGLTKEEIEQGFVSLFNGKNLDGWQGNKTDYYAENGDLVVNPKRGGRGNLFTEKEYGNFVFRFDFQLTPGANNGLGIRAPLEGDAAYVGMELQILDNTASIYANLHDYQYHGSVYGIIPAKRGFLNPAGDWNSQEVIVQGSKVKIILNGETILDGDLKEATKNGTLDGKNHPGLLRDKGYIGFLGHGSELKFRNIRIKDLGM